MGRGRVTVMKLTKADLKDVVKECLLEILSEGLGAAATSGRPQAMLGGSARNSGAATQSIFSEKTRGQQQSDRVATPQLREAIKRNSGGNKVMEQILADTAATTLPTMLQNDRGPNGAPPHTGGTEQFDATPEEVFGSDASSKWANLAFGGSPTKN